MTAKWWEHPGRLMGGKHHLSGFVCLSSPIPILPPISGDKTVLSSCCWVSALLRGNFRPAFRWEGGSQGPLLQLLFLKCLPHKITNTPKQCVWGWRVLNLFLHKTPWQSSWSSPLPQARSRGITPHVSRRPCQCPQMPSACLWIGCSWVSGPILTPLCSLPLCLRTPCCGSPFSTEQPGSAGSIKPPQPRRGRSWW